MKEKLSIGRRVGIGFAVVVLILLVSGGVNFFLVSMNMRKTDRLVDVNLNYLNKAYQLKVLALQHRRYEKDFFLNIGNSEKQQGYKDKFLNQSTRLQIFLQEIKQGAVKYPEYSEISDYAEKAEVAYEKYYKGFIKLTSELKNNSLISSQEANLMMIPYKDYIYEFEDNIDLILQKIDKNTGKNVSKIKTGNEYVLVLNVLIIISGLILSLIISFFLIVNINRFLQTVIFRMAENMSGLNNISSEINSSSRNLSGNSSSLAATIEEMTSSMEELQAAVSTNSGNITLTKDELESNTKISELNSENMARVQESINEIHENAEQVSKIIKVIDDIAFQTNILALNASVEAARAGEAGGGFAVVAEQVKTLANKSADAAKESSELIDKMLESVMKGLEMGEISKGNALESKKNIDKIAGLMNDVNTASVEQNKGIGQITESVTSINRIIQSTASSAEENQKFGDNLLQIVYSTQNIVEELKQMSGMTSSKRKKKQSVQSENKEDEKPDLKIQKQYQNNKNSLQLSYRDEAPVQNNSKYQEQSQDDNVELVRPDDVIPMDDFKDLYNLTKNRYKIK